METIWISSFRATSLAVLRRVHTTGQTVRITRRGEPVGDIVPLRPPERPAGWLGSMSNHIRIAGDIITPTCDLAPVGRRRRMADLGTRVVDQGHLRGGRPECGGPMTGPVLRVTVYRGFAVPRSPRSG